MQSNAAETFLLYAIIAAISVTFLVIAIAAFGECHERNRRRKAGLESYNE